MSPPVESAASAYEVAWTRAFEVEAAGAEVYRLAGVPIGVLGQIAALTEQAALRWDWHRNGLNAVAIRSDLLEVARAWCKRGPLGAARVSSWLPVMAAAPDPDVADQTFTMWMDWVGDGAVSTPVWVAWMRLPGEVGAWGWAAGLSPAEASEMALAEVRAMAALRGFDVGAPSTGGAVASRWTG